MEELTESFASFEDLRQYREEVEAALDESLELMMYGFSVSRELKPHLMWEYKSPGRQPSLSDLMNKPLSQLLEEF